MIKNLLKLFIFFFFRLIPKDKKLLVFGDRAGRRFADNSRYLFLYMSKNFKEFHCVWITKEKSIYEYLNDNKLDCAYSNSFKGVYYSIRAKYHLFNFVEDDIDKFITYFSNSILLWHGVLPKKLTIPKNHYVKNYVNKNLIKYLIYPNEFMAQNILDHFVDKKYDLFKSGLPRNITLGSKEIDDDYYKTNKEISFLKEIKKQNKKVIGYFPTWREDGIELFRDIQNFDQLKKFNEILLKNNFFILIKKHMNSEKKDSHRFYNSKIEKIYDYMRSLSNFKFVDYDFDLNSVLESCDVLISDYSGVIFDYLLLDRPIIAYTPDYSYYLNKGFNMDPTKENFCYTAFNFSELINLVNDFAMNDEYFCNHHSKNRKIIKNKIFVENDIDKLVKLITN